MVLGSFGRDVIDHVIRLQFNDVQRYDFSLGLFEPASSAMLPAIGRLPGVMRVEAFRSVPVRLVNGRRARRTALLGLAEDRELLRLLDLDSRPVALPGAGVLLSEKLANVLGVHPGEWVTAEVMEGDRPARPLLVTGTVSDFSGLSAWMNLSALNRFMREGRVVSGAFLHVDSAAEPRLYAAVKESPRIASLISQKASLRSFQETLSETLLTMRTFNLLFASIIAFGVVYNAARISLAERSRDLATLRVIGLTRGEVSSMLIGEVLTLTLGALPAGMLIGRALAGLASWALETETLRLPVSITPATYAMAGVTILLAALVSCLVVRRRIDQLDLVAVLKSRD